MQGTQGVREEVSLRNMLNPYWKDGIKNKHSKIGDILFKFYMSDDIKFYMSDDINKKSIDAICKMS